MQIVCNSRVRDIPGSNKVPVISSAAGFQCRFRLCVVVWDGGLHYGRKRRK